MEDAVRERVDQHSSQGSNAKDFHSELMLLRKRWRLKRTGASIIGDLTYRSGKKDVNDIYGKLFVAKFNPYNICLIL